VKRGARPVTEEVAADGAGSVSRADSAVIAQAADELGPTWKLSLRLAWPTGGVRGHAPSGVNRDLAVMLASGDCLSDVGAIRKRR
jgi:hypothetical protein